MSAPSVTSIVLQHQNALTREEAEFVRFYAVEGMTASAAAKMAGIEGVQGSSVLQRAVVRTAVQDAFAENAKRLDVGRDDVLRGMKEAIDMARTIGDPTAMIRGWSEVGKITGLYTVKTELNITTNDINSKTNMKKLSTQDLADLVTGKKQFSDVLEGEFTVLGAE